MPKTPPTIVAPLPHDPRVMTLAKTVSLTRREAFAAAAEAWAWMSVQAVDDIVPQTAPDSLDSVVDIADFGQAMLEAGLVGVVNDGLVLPAELRHRQRDERGGGAAAAADVPGASSSAARRQKKYRDRKRLSVPAPKREKPMPTAEAPRPMHKPRCLGTVEGCPVMLLFSNRTGCWFYKLDGAMPREFTGTVTDQDAPSFADALMALHNAMKREAGKGLGQADTFSPTMEQMVAAAERERDALLAAAAAAARRDEANKALAEASAEDQDKVLGGACDRNESVTGDARNVTPVTGDVLRDDLRYAETQTTPAGEAIYDDAARYDSRYAAAPSSSSSSLSSLNQERKENTTTTSEAVAVDRDVERLDRFLERMKPQHPSMDHDGPERQGQLERWRNELADRFAVALQITRDEVFRLRDTDKPELLARLLAAGIDPNTGLTVNAEGASEPEEAHHDISVTIEPIENDEPATGSVEAPGDADRRHGEDVGRPCHDPAATFEALNRLGITPPTLNGVPGRGHRLDGNAFEHDDQGHVVEQLLP